MSTIENKTGPYEVIIKQYPGGSSVETHYLNGIEFMQIEKYDDGKIQNIWNFDKESELHGLQHCVERGGHVHAGWFCHGQAFGLETEEVRHPDGKKFVAGEYMMIDFTRNGPYTRYYHDGEVREEGYFLGGKLLDKNQANVMKAFYENSDMKKMMDYRLSRCKTEVAAAL